VAASQFVGRVGGLAVAIGIGTGIVVGCSTAWADTDSGSSPETAGTKTGAAAAGPAKATRGQGNSGASRMSQRSTNRPASSATVRPSTRVQAAAAAPAAIPDPTDTGPVPVATFTAPPASAAPADPVSEPLTDAASALSDGVSPDPLASVDDSPSEARPEVIRGEPAGAIAAPVALASPAQSATGSLSVDPTVEITTEGIVQGTLRAVSARGLPMTYTVLGTPCQPAVGSGDSGSGCGLGSNGGKLTIATVPVTPGSLAPDPQSYTILPFATWLDGGSKGTETFKIRVSEVTGFDNFITGIPLVGSFAAPVIDLLQKLPLVSVLLAPLIGASVVATVNADVAALAPGDRQLGFTYKVTSFDGTKISTNFFPAVGVGAGVEEVAPTVLVGPGITQAGYTGPYDQAPPTPAFWAPIWIGSQRKAGYNVITWDPRGEWNSTGILQGNNPFFEGRDVSEIMDWATINTPVQTDETGIAVGMLGYSYGGGIQLVTAGTDPRIDAIVPEMTYNNLLEAIYPDQIYKTVFGTFFSVWLNAVGARINPQINSQAITGDLFGFITQTAQAMFASSGATALLNKITAPTLLPQGTSDMLFTLQQAIQSAQTLEANPYNVPVKMIWFCGGHGACNTGEAPGQNAMLIASRLAWLDQYVKRQGSAADALPTFQWYDQTKVLHTSNLMPYDPAFATRKTVATGAGGKLAIAPIVGGSSRAFSVPSDSLTQFVTSLPVPGVARNAINVDLSTEVLTAGTQVVGAPEVTFNYSGVGSSNALFAQLIVTDAKGNKSVVGDQVAPVPVTLDGRQRSITVPFNIANVAYTVQPGDKLTLQLTSSALVFASISAFGVVNVSDIAVTLPIVN
jgi:ABC-2 type transport system ATP-binding protein